MVFGPFSLPLFPPEKQCRAMPNYPVTPEQQALLTALWQISTPNSKHTAINALNYYFSSLLPTYYAVFTGYKPGIYTNSTSFDLVKHEQYKQYHQFSEAFDALSKHLKTTNFFIETEQASTSSSNKTSLTTVKSFSPSKPQNSSYTEALAESLLKDKEIERLNQSVDYWRSRPEAYRSVLSKNENQMLIEREKFSQEKTVLEAQITVLKRELQQCNNMMLQFSAELRAFEEPEASNPVDPYPPFEQYSRHLALLPSKQEQFLNLLPENIANYIVNLADNSIFSDLLDCQYMIEIITENKEQYPGLNIVQYNPQSLTLVLPNLQTQLPVRECLLAQVDWNHCTIKELIPKWFFNGMLSSIYLHGDERVPDFFGPYITRMIQQYKGAAPLTIQVDSDFPNSYNLNYYPAHHQLFLHFTPVWDSIYGVFTVEKPRIITDEQYYVSYHSQLDPQDTWILHAKTEIIQVWVPYPAWHEPERI